jgi:hypothetical protein
MLDITYPLFGGAIFLTTVCAACMWGRMTRLTQRIAMLEARSMPVPTPAVQALPYPDPQPPAQHTEVYIPPRPSAPPVVLTGLYYNDQAPRTAVI